MTRLMTERIVPPLAHASHGQCKGASSSKWQSIGPSSLSIAVPPCICINGPNCLWCAHRTAVLRKLGHVTKEGVVTLKGRAACEISTGDELLTTELMFNGVFNSLDKHQLVALLSCLVPVEKSNVCCSWKPRKT